MGFVNSKHIALIHVRIVLLIFLWFEVSGKALDFKSGCKIQQSLSNVGNKLPAIEMMEEDCIAFSFSCSRMAA
jgi:hypothetical protein